MTAAGGETTSVLITDVDNTLFDWVGVWYHSFRPMLSELVRISGVPEDTLIAEIKCVHQWHGTAEYAFLVEEVPSLVAAARGRPPAEVYASAIDAYRMARRSHLKLYPGVMDTLLEVKRRGCAVVAYTESMAFYSNYRLRRLGLDGVIDVLYSPPDHDLPPGMTREQARQFPAWHYQFKQTVHRHTPTGELKPNPGILRQIVADTNSGHGSAVYVGDSLTKDVVMAQRAKVSDVWAAYGSAHTRPEYELLTAVTHWTAETVERERALSAVHANPTHTLDAGFAQLLDLFDFAGGATATT